MEDRGRRRVPFENCKNKKPTLQLVVNNTCKPVNLTQLGWKTQQISVLQTSSIIKRGDEVGKRTVSNLSRETSVSRQTIYKKIKELNISYNGNEFSEADYKSLKNKLSNISNINKSKESLPQVEIETEKDGSIEKLEDTQQSTLKKRLKDAKDQYNYYDALIQKFRAEIDEYFKRHKKTTILNHNGTESSIPAIMSLEKHVKLNISLSKLISELESKLNDSGSDEDDPFV